MTNKKIIAILPAYNASRTLIPFLKSLPRGIFDEIILVDDASTDNTFELVKKQSGVKVYQNPCNLGYGGNLKICLGLALEHGADIMVEFHPDGEYGFDGIAPAIAEVEKGAKFVLGNRFHRGFDKQSGMFWWKYPFLRTLTVIGNLILGTKVGDLHQGFRVYTRELLEKVNFRATSNNYIFSFEIIAQAAFKGLKIAQVPVSTVYKGAKRGASLKSSIIYSLGALWILILFLGAKWGFKNTLFEAPAKPESCPNCETEYLVEKRLEKDRFTLFFCKLCGNGFTFPIPKNMSKYYPKEYWHYRGIMGAIRKAAFSYFQDRRRVWVEEIIKGGRVLDVGSGAGGFGHSLGEGFDVINLEALFTNELSFPRKRESMDPRSGPGMTGNEFIKADFLKWETNQKFDAICFWESLEHVPQPQKYLQKASSLLKKKGYIFIEYPRYSSFEAKIFGNRWFHLDMPRHLAHFTDQGLDFISNRAGLKKVDQSGILALEYAPLGLAASLMPSLRGMRSLALLGTGSANTLRLPRSLRSLAMTKNVILLFPILVICSLLEIVLFLLNQSPIGLVVLRKNEN